MTRRRNPFLVLALFACLMQCQSGHTQVASWPPGPVDSGAEFRVGDDPEPAPAPEPEPSVVVAPKIEGPATLKPGQMGDYKLTYKPADGARVKVRWEIVALDHRPLGNWELIATGAPGARGMLVAVVIVVTADDIADYRITYPVTVEGAGPTPPPGPGPQPPTPVVSLRDLVPDAKAREQLATFYGDLAAVVKAGGFTSTTHFRNGYRMAIATAQGAGSLPKGLAPIDKPVSDRIAAAISLADAPLDDAKKSALVVALESIAAEFGGK